MYQACVFCQPQNENFQDFRRRNGLLARSIFSRGAGAVWLANALRGPRWGQGKETGDKAELAPQIMLIHSCNCGSVGVFFDSDRSKPGRFSTFVTQGFLSRSFGFSLLVTGGFCFSYKALAPLSHGFSSLVTCL